jgi:hypothetical protein
LDKKSKIKAEKKQKYSSPRLYLTQFLILTVTGVEWNPLKGCDCDMDFKKNFFYGAPRPLRA